MARRRTERSSGNPRAVPAFAGAWDLTGMSCAVCGGSFVLVAWAQRCRNGPFLASVFELVSAHDRRAADREDHPMTTTTGQDPAQLPEAGKPGRWIADWRPEDASFWEQGGSRVALRNLVFSIFS